MLPKINRLRNTKDIERVFGGGKGIKGDFLSLKFLRNGLAVGRFAFIVSRKVSKKAVQRNKIKRVLRAIIQEKMARIQVGFDLVITALRSAENRSFREMEKDIEAILNRGKLIV